MLRLDFNENWLFHDGDIVVERPAVKGPVYTQAKTESYRRGPASIGYADGSDDYGGGGSDRELAHERWDRVKLPHDYQIGDTPDPKENNALGFVRPRPAWYRKHFTPDDAWQGRSVKLVFGAVASECDVYLNGSFLSHNVSAYNEFSVDLSDFLRYGRDNVLAVRTSSERIESWWYTGAGITRKVRLEIREPVAVAQYGIYVAPRRKSGDLWEVPFEITLENASFAPRGAAVAFSLLDGDEPIAKTNLSASLEAMGRVKLSGVLSVNDPELWDTENPVLYTARAVVVDDLSRSDVAEAAFGFREIRFTPDEGFFLNGRHVTLFGVCGHGDYGLTGRAVPANIHRYKLRLLRKMGANAYRASHYMQDEEFMDALDRAGILLMAETRNFSTAPVHLDALRTLVLRDRNHPCVILWSVGNEEHSFITDEGRRIAERMIYEVKALDPLNPSRPVMTANDKNPEVCTVYEASDAVAVNYNLPLLDRLHEKFPDKPILSSECCATSTTRGWYHADSPEHGYLSAYDKETNAWFTSRRYAYSLFRERPWLSGSFQWTGIEYRGEAVWPRLASQSGAIDLFLQEKDAFWQNRSLFSSDPMIHLLPHWNLYGREGEEVLVRAYTNCEKAILFLNDVSLGIVDVPPCGYAEWKVPFTPGKLLARGLSADMHTLCEDEKVSTGAPVALKLRLENGDDLKANGEDVAHVTCYAVDAEGREVPDASPFVRFAADGAKILGTGSSVADHAPVTLPDRQMYAGRISIALLPAKAPDALSPALVPSSRPGFLLYAEAAGLTTAALRVEL